MTSSQIKSDRRVRLVASDLDGTLLRSDGSVSRRTLSALERTVEAGIRVVLVSARSADWLAPEVARLGAGEIAICNNGALVYDVARKRVLIHRPLEPETARDLARRLRRAAPGVAFGCDRPSDFTAEPAYRPLHRSPDSLPRADLPALLAEPITKLVLQHPDLPQDELHRLVCELGDGKIEACYSGAGLVEIAAAGVTKGSALALLGTELGIEASEAIAFGDMPNDVSMLEWAGRGVAVASAHPDLLLIADEVTASNDDDGVALVLERVLAAS
jgi:Cof subfamily protein (haloacid dehalogenase superfamily)